MAYTVFPGSPTPRFSGTGGLGGTDGRGGVGGQDGSGTLFGALQAAEETTKNTVEVIEIAVTKIGQQASAIIGLYGFTARKLAEFDVSSKKSIETLEKLNSLFGEDFPASAGQFKENFRLIIDAVIKGNVSIEKAVLGMKDMERLLLLWGLSGKDLFKVSDLIRSIIEGLRELESQQGGGTGLRGLPDLLAELEKKP